MVETVMSIAGTSTTSQAGYLWFQGITFADSTYMRPSQSGFLDGQAGQYNLTATTDNKQTVGRPSAGVSVMNANHIHFERNIFTQMGATGLDFISGTNNDMIIGNVVTDIAGNGISIGKFTASDTTEYHVPYNPSDKNEICTTDTIKDNYIHNVTTEFQGGTAIAGGYPKQVDIEHNEIGYTNYTGISVGYGWTSTVNAMSNNYINYNNIHHVTQSWPTARRSTCCRTSSPRRRWNTTTFTTIRRASGRITGTRASTWMSRPAVTRWPTT